MVTPTPPHQYEQQKHQPLHLDASSSRLPEVSTERTTGRDNTKPNAFIRGKSTMLPSSAIMTRRNPYQIQSRVVMSHLQDSAVTAVNGHSQGRQERVVSASASASAAAGGNDDNAQRSSSFAASTTFDSSISNRINAPVYTSYKHGTRSIARSRNASTPTTSTPFKHQHQHHQQHPFLIASPQIDVAPDAAMTHTAASNLVRRGQKLLHDLHETSENRMNLLLFLPVMVIFVLSARSMVEPMMKPEEWSWTPDRRLDDRQCVMNLFIERQPPDEFNPDYVKPPKELSKDQIEKFRQPPPKIVKGTYRTEGQMKVITRLIESVANSYRSNILVQQHLIFTGARDGGQLAQLAKLHWPPRGSFRTQLHVVAADHTRPMELYENKVAEGILVEDPLEYGFVEAIEERFQGQKDIHVYDRYGAAPVNLFSKEGDDDYYDYGDDDADPEESGFSWSRNLQVVEDVDGYNNGENVTESNESNESPQVNVEEEEEKEKDEEDLEDVTNDQGDDVYRPPYLDLETLITRNEDDVIIPYLHVDGVNMASQMEILESARPLMEDNTIVTIGVEHSHDMDVYALIDFFNSASYKTFFLGSRQIARIDHLCPEILEDVIRHPSLTPHKLTKTAQWLKWLGLLDTDIVAEEDQMHKYPPFFVAMPRGRLNKEEMTIQHMYDLFGGYDGGGGQVQTANDRKAPGQK